MQVSLENFDFCLGPFLEIVGGDVVLGLLHQVQVEMQIVDACQGEAKAFAGVMQMTQVGAAEVTAAVAIAVRIHGLVVFFGVAGGLVTQNAFAGEQHAVSCVSGGHDAVAHVYTAADQFQQIPGGAHTHHIAGVVLGKVVGAEIGDFVHGFRGFAYGESAHGKSVGLQFSNTFDGLFTQVLMHTALHDSEELLLVTVDFRVGLKPVHGLFGPFQRKIQTVFRFLLRAGVGGTLVKGHDDVCADFALGLHNGFRAEKVLGTVQNASELHAFGLDLAQILQTPDLESTAIGQNRAVPAHKLVDAAGGCDLRGSGAQIQVVRICQDDFGLQVLQLGRGNGLDGGFCAYGHKNRRMDIAVVRMEHA